MTLAQNQNLTPDNQNVVIKTWGERLGSPYYERRRLYVEVAVSNPPTWVRDEVNLLDYAVNNIKSLLLLSTPQFPNPIPWWMYKKCQYCIINFVNSIKLKLPTNTWRTGYCLRHGLLLNNALFSIDNKERVIRHVISADDSVVILATSTNKYSVTFMIKQDRAEAEISRVDGTVTKFTYRNHVDSYPHSSAYAFLVRRILGFVNSLRDVVRICGVRNIYINGVQVCPPPASDSTDASGGEGEVGVGCGVGEAGGV